MVFFLAGNLPCISLNQTPTTIHRMKANATLTTQAARITTPPPLSQSNGSLIEVPVWHQRISESISQLHTLTAPPVFRISASGWRDIVDVRDGVSSPLATLANIRMKQRAKLRSQHQLQPSVYIIKLSTDQLIVLLYIACCRRRPGSCSLLNTWM